MEYGQCSVVTLCLPDAATVDAECELLHGGHPVLHSLCLSDPGWRGLHGVHAGTACVGAVVLLLPCVQFCGKGDP